MTAPHPYFDNPIALKPAEVIVPERIGLFWPEKASALGALMKRDGQTDPIKVHLRKVKGSKEQAYFLVAGLHRLEGAKLAGLESIQALVVVTSDASELLMLEASENVHRRDFGPIERALFVRAIAFAAEQRAEKARGGMSPQALGAKERWERARASVATRADDLATLEADYAQCQLGTNYGWSDEVAESLGLSRRALFRALKLHRQLIAPFERDLWEALARTELGQKQAAMLEVASITDVAARRRVMEVIADTSDGEIKTVAEAMVLAGAKEAPVRAPADGQTKFINNAQSNLTRMTAGSQRSFAPTLAESIKPSALLAVREAITARIRLMSPEELGDEA